MSTSKTVDFDPYKVLNVTAGCSEVEVDKAYKKLALKWHPDKAMRNGVNKSECENMFVKIYQAYEFLKDKTLRTAYDDKVAIKKRRREFEEERKSQTSAKRQRFLDELNEKEAAFDSRKRKTPHSTFNLDKELERLRKEGAEYLTRINQTKAKPAPTMLPVQKDSSVDCNIYNLSAQGLKDLEELELEGL